MIYYICNGDITFMMMIQSTSSDLTTVVAVFIVITFSVILLYKMAQTSDVACLKHSQLFPLLLTKTHNFLVRRLQNFGEGSRQNCWVVPIPQHMLQRYVFFFFRGRKL